MTLPSSRSTALEARLQDLALFATTLALAGILTAAMALQYAAGEIPCPLCLLQRVAMFGVAFGSVGHARHGYSTRNIGMSLLWTVFLLIISVRQVLLNITPRPGHSYPGGTVFGVHMPVWSVVIAVALLLAFAAELAVFDADRLRAARPSRRLLSRCAGVLNLYVIALCLINLASALLQCGLGACHTTGYKLL